MKRIITVTFLLCVLSSSSLAVIHFFVDAPQDVREARAWAADQPGVEAFRSEYFDLIKARLRPIPFSRMERIFGPKLGTATNWWGSDKTNQNESSGPKLSHYPADLVLPVFASNGGTNCSGVLKMMVSGLHSKDPAQNKSHTDLFAVGDIGYVEFYSQLDGEQVQTAVLYCRADEKFVPLKSTNDLPARLAWDKARFGALKRWFDSHLGEKLKS